MSISRMYQGSMQRPQTGGIDPHVLNAPPSAQTRRPNGFGRTELGHSVRAPGSFNTIGGGTATVSRGNSPAGSPLAGESMAGMGGGMGQFGAGSLNLGGGMDPFGAGSFNLSPSGGGFGAGSLAGGLGPVGGPAAPMQKPGMQTMEQSLGPATDWLNPMGRYSSRMGGGGGMGGLSAMYGQNW